MECALNVALYLPPRRTVSQPKRSGGGPGGCRRGRP